MHSGIWEKIGEAFLWLQLCWIVAGFALMLYLAMRVFPKSDEPLGRDRRGADGTPKWHIGYDGIDRRQSVVAGNYRQEAFPQKRLSKAKIIEFRTEISERNRRFS